MDPAAMMGMQGMQQPPPGLPPGAEMPPGFQMCPLCGSPVPMPDQRMDAPQMQLPPAQLAAQSGGEVPQSELLGALMGGGAY